MNFAMWMVGFFGFGECNPEMGLKKYFDVFGQSFTKEKCIVSW